MLNNHCSQAKLGCIFLVIFLTALSSFGSAVQQEIEVEVEVRERLNMHLAGDKDREEGLELYSTLLVPKSFLNLLFDGRRRSYVLLIESQTQTAFLFDFRKEPPGLQIVKEFEIATGKQKGAKRSEWDLRTPQGYYEITQYRCGESLPAKYGPGAYVLNYPNALEQAEGKTGSGIWIHGTDRVDFIDHDSEGCVRFKNEELPLLADYLEPRQSPVIIVDRIEWVSFHQLAEKKETFMDRVDHWLKCWESNTIEEYLSFYHPSFNAPHHMMDLIRWYDHKRNIFANNPPLSITFDLKKVIWREGVIVVSAKQQYLSQTFSNVGTKTLLWKKSNDNWYIVLEDWNDK